MTCLLFSGSINASIKIAYTHVVVFSTQYGKEDMGGDNFAPVMTVHYLAKHKHYFNHSIPTTLQQYQLKFNAPLLSTDTYNNKVVPIIIIMI
jgi:hypothetical protein